MITSIKQNWKIYSMEAICLGIFMVSASVFATLLEYPRSTVHLFLSNNFLRLCLMGIAMGLTAIGISYSPMGKLSGAHMNPAVTLSFLFLRKIKRTDAFFYMLFQLVGGITAVTVMSLVLGNAFRNEHVNYVVTAPGKSGVLAALVVELIMSFGMMIMILTTSNMAKSEKYTGVIAGIFVMSFVIFSSPISGFSINPARTIASAIPSGMYPSFWIYMIAPFLGMFSAASIYEAIGGKAVCAKMNHSERYKCIFNCGYCKHPSAINSQKAITNK